MHLAFDVSLGMAQLVIVAMLFVLFCVWTVALTRAWRHRRP
ncbi:MAG TPA: hypothetical protein VMS54_09240 [Vicinamibacterales bacterium]|nr:hypothetical protein [Vicinamibacterales bacterium]